MEKKKKERMQKEEGAIIGSIVEMEQTVRLRARTSMSHYTLGSSRNHKNCVY